MRRSIGFVVFPLTLFACSTGGSSGGGAASTTDAGASSDVDATVAPDSGGALSSSDDAGTDLDASAPGTSDGDIGLSDGGDGGACEWGGSPGDCITVSACAALGDHTSYAGECPGPATIECCIVTPNVADNPPTPTGYVLMQQAAVTTDMTTWAVAILNDPTDYPMFSTATKVFGALTVLARVEWHPPDFQNSVIHRGVTLYQPDTD